MIQPQKERTVADGNKNIFGHRTAELLIDLMCHPAHAVGKERIVDMGGIVITAQLRTRHAARVHPSVRHTHDISAIRSDLLNPLCGYVIRHIDPARDARSRCIGGNGGAGIARGVDHNALYPKIGKLSNETLRPTVLKGAGRLTILHFKIKAQSVNRQRQKRCHRLPERYRHVGTIFVHLRLVQVKKTAAFTRVGMRCDGVFLFASLTVEVHDGSSS